MWKRSALFALVLTVSFPPSTRFRYHTNKLYLIELGRW